MNVWTPRRGKLKSSRRIDFLRKCDLDDIRNALNSTFLYRPEDGYAARNVGDCGFCIRVFDVPISLLIVSRPGSVQGEDPRRGVLDPRFGGAQMHLRE
jgi:hypothetical protein